MKKHGKQPGRVLVIQTAFIGDVILTLPLVQEARRSFPDARIDFLTIPASANIVETHRDIARLWVYDKHKADRGWQKYLDLAKSIRREKYDLALVPHRSMRSALLAWLGRIPRRVGFHRSAGRFLLTDVLPYPYGIHEIPRNLHLLKPFSFQPGDDMAYPDLHFTEADRQNIAAWMETASISADQELIALAPGSVWATKRWLPEYYANLAGRLIERGYKVVMVGGPGDMAVADDIQNFAGNKLLNAVGKLSLRESAALIERCRLLVSNDSAPMHMAVAVRTPVIAIFGSTVKHFGFYPVGKHDRVAELDGLPCRPCGRHGKNACPLGTLECMKGVPPARVFAMAMDVLSETKTVS